MFWLMDFPIVIGSDAYRKKILDDNETFTKNFVSEKERVVVRLFPFQRDFFAQRP